MLLQLVKSLIVFLYLFLLPPLIFAQTPTETPTTLELNKPIEREIKGGETHSYQVNLEKGQFGEVILEQKGVDVLIRVFEPDGKAGNWFDGQIITTGIEKVAVLAENTGLYRLDVEVKLKSSPIGRYEIHLAAIRELTDFDRQYNESNLLIKQSDRLFDAGKYQEGVPFAEKALAIREKILPPDSPDIGIACSNLGILYLNIPNYNRAEPLYLRALDIWQKAFGENNLNVAAALSNLALIYLNKGDFDKAENFLLRTIAIREKILGQNHTLVAGAYNTLGRIYRRKNEIMKAVKAYELALSIRETLFGKDSTPVAAVLKNLSTLYYYNGDFEKSLELDERVLTITEKTLGSEHPDVVGALENLGLSYTEIKQFDKAEPIYHRALAICEKAYGVGSIKSSSILTNLAILYFKKEEYEKSVKIGIIVSVIRIAIIDVVRAINTKSQIFVITKKNYAIICLDFD